MSERLSSYQSNMVRAGLEAALSLEVFKHPDSISNFPNEIQITDRQKSYYLHQLADKGTIERRYHLRGWYCWCTFRRVYKNGNDPVEAQGLTLGEIPF
jgi:hypothetical protein